MRMGFSRDSADSKLRIQNGPGIQDSGIQLGFKNTSGIQDSGIQDSVRDSGFSGFSQDSGFSWDSLGIQLGFRIQGFSTFCLRFWDSGFSKHSFEVLELYLYS